MVTVTNYLQKKNAEGKKFFALELTGEVEIAFSQSGRSFATAKKCNIPSTFDEEECKIMIGKQLPGTIRKVDAEPYEFKPKKGDPITLNYRYEYSAEENSMEAAVFQQELPL
jgi:hypothetical protein